MGQDDSSKGEDQERRATANADSRAPYERPRLGKKRSVARATLVSGGFGTSGATGSTSLTGT
jgi:hypothetical protein